MVPHTHDALTAKLREILDLQAQTDAVRTESDILIAHAHALRQRSHVVRRAHRNLPHTLPAASAARAKESHEPHP
jgi:hypothetical protein